MPGQPGEKRKGERRQQQDRREAVDIWQCALLGPPLLRSLDRVLTLGAKRSIAAIAYLKMAGAVITREALLDLLWPEAGDVELAAGAFRTMLSRCKQKLPGLLSIDRQTVRLNEALCSWDIDRFNALSNQHGLEALEQARQLYRGPFMDRLDFAASLGWQDWLLEQRQYWQERYHSFVRHYVDTCLLQGEVQKAITCVEHWINQDPYCEEAYLQSMWLYHQLGETSTALAQYDRLRHHLAEVWGEPDIKTRQLYDLIVLNAAVTASDEPRWLQRDQPVAGFHVA